ncbi:MAG: hypothetical protein ACYCT1_14335 [Steroidobacteraceae bacterium]
MVRVARATTDLQRLAAGRRPRHAALWLAAARAGVPALLLAQAFGVLHHASAAVLLLLALAVLAGALAAAASSARLARLAWVLLRPHCRRLVRHAAARRASARARALALKHNVPGINVQRRKLICAAMMIIGSRLLPHICISPRLVAERPN